MIPVDRRPHPIGAVLSVLTGAFAIYLLTGAWTQTQPLLAELAGLALVLGGIELYRRNSRLLGIGLAVVGLGAVGGGIALGYIYPTTQAAKLELLPGMVGLLLLLFGAARIPRRLARPLLLAGAGFIFLSVLVSGIVQGSELTALLGATVCTIVAWDVAEQGLNLAEQVGRRASTLRVRLVNGTGSFAIGGIGMGIAMLIIDIGPTSLSLTNLLVMLGATLVLALALLD
jgi:hypothetical protein